MKLLYGDPHGRITASEIRAQMQAGGRGWHSLVPPATVSLLDELLARVPMGERT